KRDLQGAWAVRSQFNFGLDVFDATNNSSSAPDGSFFSWLGQIQRVQRLGRDNLLIAQADVQLTPDALLPSQQFLIGGGQSLRGYRQNARAGDNGFRFSVEDRIAILRDQGGLSNLQLAPFVDMGAVWNVSDNPNRLPDQTFLASAGLGLIWEPVPRLLMRFDYAVPFVDLSDRGNNAQDRGFNFSVTYNF
ncbi:MAG: ShlB/FhaC/HecB family hemolysin secretion/activation protein, partial [Mastigocladus sp. ERB_26_1]